MVCFFFQAEDGIRDLVRSRGLGDVYKRQIVDCNAGDHGKAFATNFNPEINIREVTQNGKYWNCLLYTSDAADERSSVDLGGRRIIKKKKSCEHRAQYDEE